LTYHHERLAVRSDAKGSAVAVNEAIKFRYSIDRKSIDITDKNLSVCAGSEVAAFSFVCERWVWT
tara:strand:- start:1662 stop:1856 length:195 start_codon:yes stop_codon:yes gene_type:complete